jgi:hypothetical protein
MSIAFEINSELQVSREEKLAPADFASPSSDHLARAQITRSTRL